MKILKGHTGRNTHGNRIANHSNDVLRGKAYKAATGTRPPTHFCRDFTTYDYTDFRAGRKSDGGFADINDAWRFVTQRFVKVVLFKTMPMIPEIMGHMTLTAARMPLPPASADDKENA
jgi:hypothetical protein